MNPNLRILEALEACFSNTFQEGYELTFTESQALSETFSQIDLIEFENLLEETKNLVLLNWRLSQRSVLGTLIYSNIFRIVLENETIIKHLWSIRNDQDRSTVLEIKAAVLDRILDGFSYELESFLDEFDNTDLIETEKNALLNCDPTKTVVTVVELCGMLRMLDADLIDVPIELTVFGGDHT